MKFNGSFVELSNKIASKKRIEQMCMEYKVYVFTLNELQPYHWTNAYRLEDLEYIIK